MSTKRKIAETIIKRIGGDTEDARKKYDPRFFYVDMDRLYGWLVKRTIMENQDVSGEFLSTYDVSVLLDLKRNRKYILLPCMPIALPAELGVFHISTHQDEETQFIPVNAGFEWMFDGLTDLEGNIGYKIEGRKVFFTKEFEDTEIKELLVKLIAGIEGLEEDDFFPCPPEIEYELAETIARPYLQLAGLPTDKIADGNAAT